VGLFVMKNNASIDYQKETMETKTTRRELNKTPADTSLEKNIIKDYNDGVITTKEIGEKHNIPRHTVYNILKRNDITMRNISQGVSLFKNRNLKKNRIDVNGYPITTVNRKTVKKHKIVMEKKLNRKIGKEESIHHIDFNKNNNNIKNLILMTNSEHRKLHSSGIQEIVEIGMKRGYVIFNKKLKKYRWKND